MISDYGMISSDYMLVKCDNKSAIDISKNHVQHFRTKHIAIRHHFVTNLVERNIFPKPLDHRTIISCQKSLGCVLYNDLCL